MGKNKLKKEAIVVHSGGMDSGLCLAYAIKKWGKENVLSLSFTYGQRHSNEIEVARSICSDWGVDHAEVDLNCLREITTNALMDSSLEIQHGDNKNPPNTLVMGRNGLMARVASIHAESLGAKRILMGVIEVEEANSGYRDCSRNYMDIIQKAMRMDMGDDEFEIETPIVKMTKKETYDLGRELGVLEYLLEKTVTCYNGILKEGCQNCPSCFLRNEGIIQYAKEKPNFSLSYLDKILKTKKTN